MNKEHGMRVGHPRSDSPSSVMGWGWGGGVQNYRRIGFWKECSPYAWNIAYYNNRPMPQKKLLLLLNFITLIIGSDHMLDFNQNIRGHCFVLFRFFYKIKKNIWAKNEPLTYCTL